MSRLERIAVFCGSSFGSNEEYKENAIRLGKEMAKRSIALVYGGGAKGLMGVIAETVHENGGYVIGVLPESMDRPSVRLKKVEDELIIVPDMHERKKRMYDAADAFIAMPGGIGTIEEISEIYTWRQLGYHNKNIGLLNTADYWNHFIGMLDEGTKEGFINERVRALLIAEEDPGKLIDRLQDEEFTVPEKLG